MTSFLKIDFRPIRNVGSKAEAHQSKHGGKSLPPGPCNGLGRRRKRIFQHNLWVTFHDKSLNLFSNFSGFTEEKDDDDFRDSSSETDESISSR